MDSGFLTKGRAPDGKLILCSVAAREAERGVHPGAFMMLNKSRILQLLAVAALCLPLLTGAADKNPPASQSKGTYSEEQIVKETEQFFGKGAQGMAEVIAKAFKEQGEPVGYIKGDEGGGAVAVGLRYGKGTLQMHNGTTMQVYWQGPSFGFDFGGDAAKTFVLIYNLSNTEDLFQRFPGVEGSLYFVGGVGLHYLRAKDITLAPVRFGVGWRQGASVGYMNFSKTKRINPF
jgi:hypothetical protein